MASVIYHPDTAFGSRESLEVIVGENIYTLMPGVAQDIPAEHFTAVRTAIVAAGPGTADAIAAAPTCAIVTTGGAAGAQSYEVVPFNDQGDDVPPTPTDTTTGPTTLDATHYNTITWTDIVNTGVDGYKIVRTTGGAAQGLIGSVATGVQTFRDDGKVASAYVAAIAAPKTFAGKVGPVEI